MDIKGRLLKIVLLFFFFFKQKTAYEIVMWLESDVCSSDLFTLFSKSFSSFLHSTCLLSVSHPYLALEESYLPLRAAVPSYPTLLGPPLLERRLHGTFTLFGMPFDAFEPAFVFRRTWLQFGSSLNSRFQFWAFAGSVALTKAIFVNFFSSA